ncbi:MAG: hypothetical protein A3K19_15470 [Lentisphaerae bacterium RIFOXYB12_FULL_65_16]|nr:MAG: hypothetical protein A3K18_26475 [Lentisphaerae bacterium RIFOXYA12_64_32]OGV88499.1 MAG: hypothetical protein A3K19_15470 [Lentisphaerae bacterium RIFOXYB12_FULL_65_16]
MGELLGAQTALRFQTKTPPHVTYRYWRARFLIFCLIALLIGLWGAWRELNGLTSASDLHTPPTHTPPTARPHATTRTGRP